jgi:hypothetical protein
MKEQLSIIVTKKTGTNSGTSNLSNIHELNDLLKKGWTVLHVSPMGGGPSDKCLAQESFASLVILEKVK